MEKKRKFFNMPSSMFGKELKPLPKNITGSDARQHDTVEKELCPLIPHHQSINQNIKVKSAHSVDSAIDWDDLGANLLPETSNKHSKSKVTTVECAPDKTAWRLLIDVIDKFNINLELGTTEIIKMVTSDDELPWGIYQSGSPMGLFHFARELKKLGLRAKDIPTANGVKRGFLWEDLNDAYFIYVRTFGFPCSVGKKLVSGRYRK